MSYLQEKLIPNIDDAEAASPTMVFEFALKAKTRNKTQAKSSQRPKRIPTLTTADLKDDAKLFAWFKAMSGQRHSVVRDTYTDRMNVFAAAERALEVGDDPPALFAYIVSRKQWELISCAQEDRGHQRLRRLRNPEREAERKRHHDEDAESRTEPVAIGDIVRNIFKATCSETASCR